MIFTLVIINSEEFKNKISLAPLVPHPFKRVNIIFPGTLRCSKALTRQPQIMIKTAIYCLLEIQNKCDPLWMLLS